MNWIKSNPFLAGLAGATILICGILYVLGSKWATRYDEAKAGFDEAYQAVSAAERTPLYPTDENRDGKRKALTEYSKDIEDLRDLFKPYRPEDTANISPQAFTDRLKSASSEVSTAFGKTELPENFFLGFEGYRNQLAQSGATGTLLYSMAGIKEALLSLAEARPSALLKVHRPAVVEENGGTYQPAPTDVARYFPFEVTFKGSEASVREFLDSLGAAESHYFIVRCLKIQNERDTPPKVADAKFDPVADPTAPAAPANPFDDVFFGGGDATEEEPATEQPAVEEGGEGEEPAVVEAAPAEEVDTSRILAQVLGAEELIVFVRFDVAMFLPAKELPKP